MSTCKDLKKWCEANEAAISKWIAHVLEAETISERWRRRDDSDVREVLRQEIAASWDTFGPGPQHPLRDKTISGFLAGACIRLLHHS